MGRSEHLRNFPASLSGGALSPEPSQSLLARPLRGSSFAEADPRGIRHAPAGARDSLVQFPSQGARGSKRRGLQTRRETFLAAAQMLRQANVETPALDARLLICHAAGLSHEAYVSGLDDELAPEASACLAALIERRLHGEPVSRIVGFREFYGRSFRLDASILDPRPDTETLVEAALAIVGSRTMPGEPLKLLDLGTGSGCILITLLAELPGAYGVGVDRSVPALALARENARRLGVAGRASFVASDWLEAIGGAFDLVVANPPYLATDDIGGLPREVSAHDPWPALDGGPDGLSAYRRIVQPLRKVLRKGGVVLLETGADQAEAVLGLLGDAGIGDGQRLWRDLGGRPRVVGARG